MTALTLHKLHATGNDFLVCETAVASADVVARVCNRHTGVGADGLIVLGAPATPDADCSMTLFNADGGEAEMSGNGIRCLAWVAHRRGYGDGKRLVVDTAAGRR